MTDRADLESRVFLAIAKTMPTKQPAAVLDEIQKTHVLIDRETALYVYDVLMAANKTTAAMRFTKGWPVESVRQSAAKSDTSEHA